jgi:hypothetical protein
MLHSSLAREDQWVVVGDGVLLLGCRRMISESIDLCADLSYHSTRVRRDRYALV